MNKFLLGIGKIYHVWDDKLSDVSVLILELISPVLRQQLFLNEFLKKLKMNATVSNIYQSLKALAITFGTAALLQSCGQVRSDLNHVIKVDGSSTVYPITKAIAAAFNANPKNKFDVDVQVGFSGTGGGFKKFCAGDTYRFG